MTPSVGSRMLNGSAASLTADLHANRQASKLRDAAAQFEAVLVTQMLQSARASGDGSWAGTEEGKDSTMVEMSEQQFAQALAASGGLGIAKMVVSGLTNHENR